MEVQKDPELKHLKNTQTTLVLFNNSELKPLGTVELQTRNPKNGECYLIEYTMVSNGFKALLGAPSILQFSLTSVNVDNIMLVSGDTPNWSSVLADHKDVYAGEGKLEEKLHLNVDKTFLPVFLPVRKVPLAVKEPLKKEIDRLVAVVDSSLFYIRTTLQFGMSANFLQLSGKFDFAIASFKTPLKNTAKHYFQYAKALHGRGQSICQLRAKTLGDSSFRQ